MALIFKAKKVHAAVDVPGASVPKITDILGDLFPGVSASVALQLHFNRKNATLQNPKGDGVVATLLSEIELSEQELMDAITAGEVLAIHAVEEE